MKQLLVVPALQCVLCMQIVLVELLQHVVLHVIEVIGVFVVILLPPLLPVVLA